MSAAGSAWRCACGMLAALAFALPALGETLRDPTRPPAMLDAAARGEPNAVEAGPRLQSVLISPRRRVAVISGQTLVVGDRYGDAQLVKISENEVELRTGKSTQVLRLFAGVDTKQAHADAPASKTAGTDRSRER